MSGITKRDTQYYLADEKKSGSNGKKHKYLSNKESDQIQAFVQKGYDQKYLMKLKKNLKTISQFITHFQPEALEKIYSSLSKERKKWVAPVIQPDEEYVETWIKRMKRKKSEAINTYPISGEIVTEKGEFVRSKSEKIIADKFQKMQIPYAYEVPLKLKGYGTVYPDFAILDLKHRKTVYYEHFGMMDDPEYVRKMLEKIRMYAKCGFWFGDGLLYTCETIEAPLSIVYLESMLQKYL